MHSLNKLGDINRSPPILSQVLRSGLCNFIHNDCWELSRPKSNEYIDSIIAIISCAPTRLQEGRKSHKCWIRWWSYSPRRVRRRGTNVFWHTSRRATRNKITNWYPNRSKLVDFRVWLLKNIEVQSCQVPFSSCHVTWPIRPWASVDHFLSQPNMCGEAKRSFDSWHLDLPGSDFSCKKSTVCKD